ncbi:Beta-1 [Blattella germanica]|nr:Beta-1 [Blattella germanica]
MLTGRTKHVLHCVLLFTVIAVFEICTGGVRLGNSEREEFDPWERYGYIGTFVLYLLRLLTFLPLPQVLFNFAEDGVNILADTDWIVHLDEETLLTENSVRGILNFVLDGKHHFGQGLITYANEDVVNWVTTLADSFRVADDMGKLRLQFSMFHKPLFSWKGSYVVTQVS